MEKEFVQYPSSCKRIVFLGPESTGKTTLSQSMAAAWEDLLPIAKGQVDLENKAVQGAHDYVFCDTCLIELVIYSYIYYGKSDPIIERYAFTHRYDHYFLTYIDTPWVADDLRDKPTERAEIFAFFKECLQKKSIPFYVLKGDLDSRIQQINQKLKA